MGGMNAVQAIKHAQSKITDPTISKEEDALMLCWLLHAYSDIHQPLHTTAMFSKTRLPWWKLDQDKARSQSSLAMGWVIGQR
ncbi:hypothetical protein N9093_01765 [bacterium]|nr:hypothetical protein [bacterium]